MKLFLTSNIGGSYKENDIRIPCTLNEANHFLDLLRECCPQNASCLILCSDPENEDMNDSIRSVFEEAFRISKLPVMKTDLCDRRNENDLVNRFYDYDLLLFAGGHVPTQNQFFHKINLAELLIHYKGIMIGISAGTMNCADLVYAQPELDGEAVDPNYQRYLEGLYLTTINVLPHYQDIKDMTVDGLRVLEDISLPDSIIRPFYALVDGAYILVDGGTSTLYGEAYYLKDGTVTKICDTNECVLIS